MDWRNQAPFSSIRLSSSPGSSIFPCTSFLAFGVKLFLDTSAFLFVFLVVMFLIASLEDLGAFSEVFLADDPLSSVRWSASSDTCLPFGVTAYCVTYLRPTSFGWGSIIPS